MNFKIASLIFRKLGLTHFRNHRNSNFDFSSRIVGIAGPNGAGKTSVLDAIHYLSVGKGLTAASDTAFLLEGEDFFRLECRAEKGDDTDKLVVKYQRGKGKVLERNDSKISTLAEHVGKYPVVSMIPQDIDLILSGSKERRRVMDITFSQIDNVYFRGLVHYSKLIRQRNAFLKNSLKENTVNWSLLRAYDIKIKPHADLLFSKRTEYCSELLSYFKEYYRDISGGSENVEFRYLSQLQEAGYGDLTARSTEKDRIMGRSHIGCHKDDLDFSLLDRKLRDVASQGQLKSTVLSLKLAAHRLIKDKIGVDPAFLLDDLFDRLDMKRAFNFLKVVKEHTSGQIFITDTNANRLTDTVSSINEKFTIFSVENGQVMGIVDE